MNLDRRKQIEQRAYALWEAEGYPHGRHEDHWHRAADEIEAEDTVGQATRRTPRRVSRRAEESSEGRSPPRKRKARDEVTSARP